MGNTKCSGAVATQIALSEKNEFDILFMIGKFGWLSKSQIATMCCLSVESARHIIRRMISKRLIWSESFDQSPDVKAYALTRKGAQILKADDSGSLLEKITAFYTNKGFLSSFEHQYHRHLGNEILVALKADNIQIGRHVIEYIKPEHELQKLKGTANSIFQCVPDALALTSEGVLLVVEIERSSRGVSQHRGSLTHWLEVLSEAYEKNGFYAGSLQNLFKELSSQMRNKNTVPTSFIDVEQVFVCGDELIFRNIWRKVEKATQQYCSIRENICYFIIEDNKRWHNIFNDAELLFHDESETRERVDIGSRLFKYDIDQRMKIVNQLYSLGLTRKQVAARNGISVSTLDRWSRDFKQRC